MTREQLTRQIGAAFKGRPRPGRLLAEGQILYAAPDERDLGRMAGEFAQGRTKPLALTEVDTILGNYCFITEGAFVFLLPQLLSAVLHHEDQLNRGLEWLLYALTSVPGMHQGFVRSLSAKEKRAIGDFLQYVLAADEFSRARQVSSKDLTEAATIYSN